MVFGPRDSGLRARCDGILCEAIDRLGLKVLGWRSVPTDNSTLGTLAQSSEPVIRQLFIDGAGLEPIN